MFTDGPIKNRMNPTHSFDVERELIKALGRGKQLQYCGYQKYNARHNKHCGLHEDGGAADKPPSAVDFAECVQVNSTTLCPQKLTGLISPYTNPVSVLSVPFSNHP